MRKLYTLALTIFILQSSIFEGRAQWVSIPDTNFGTWLYVRYGGPCMQGNSQVGWQIDTSCGTFTSITILNCKYANISDLTGIQYFDGLTSLTCSANPLISIPALPRMLTKLTCDSTQLTSLPPLPGTLTQLICRFNQLLTLPPLPSGLTLLNCHVNQLTALPPLPAGLTGLGCGTNPLGTLPALPLSLTGLSCNNNLLTSLPPLPPNLVSLACHNNQIASIPELPDSLTWLEVVNNPNLRCLPKLGIVNRFYFNNTGITCLPNYPRQNQYSDLPLSNIPLCGPLNSNGCDVHWNIGGNVYADGNANCTSDTLEERVDNVKVKLWSGGTLIQEMFTVDGAYSFLTDTLGVYGLSIDTSGLPFDITCPVNNLLYDTITMSDSVVVNRNLALDCKSGFDLAAWSIEGRFRPADTRQVDIHVGSLSDFFGINCGGGISGNVTIVISGPAGYVAPAPGALTPDNVNGDSITYNVADFGNTDFNGSFNIMVQTDTMAVIGDTICFWVSVSSPFAEAVLVNNIQTHCFVVVGSFDPNDKQAYPAGYIDTSQRWLTYTIRFQNTGTDTAIHIYISDTLDSDLDPAYFQLLAYSHQPMVQVKGKALRFNFPYIHLPDSNVNEPLSHGYVQYRVRVNEGLPVGTTINNTAFIYFDFNAPVVTNTTVNTIACYPVNSSISRQICSGDSYYFHGQALNANGVYHDTLSTVYGCDSLVELNLTVLPKSSSSDNASICSNETYYYNGRLLSVAGVYYDTLNNVNGCDSLIALNLAVIPTSTASTSASICNHESYAFNGMLLTTAGVYHDTLSNVTGCDSVVSLSLSVYPVYRDQIDTSIIDGYPYTLPSGNIVMVPGVYNDTLLSIYGCDSVVIINLTVLSQIPAIDYADRDLRIYPNPATNELIMLMSSANAEQIWIYDVAGKLVSIINQPLSNRIDISALSAGAYIAEVTTGYVVRRARWVKM